MKQRHGLTRTCLNCNTEFYVQLSLKEKKFCSKKCYTEFLRKYGMLEPQKKALRDGCKRHWELAKKDPEYMAWWSEKVSVALKKYYANPEKRKHLSESHKGISPPNKGARTGAYKECEACGRSFYVFNSDASTRRFCSRACMVSILKEKGWHYLHPKSSWFSQTLVKQVGKCEVCGFSDERILMVHHKDSNRKNRSRENLIVLCPNHHMIAHLNSEGKLDLRGWKS